MLYKVKKGIFYISDPAVRLVKYTKVEFGKSWLSTKTGGEDKGVALLVYKQGELKKLSDHEDKSSLKILIPYFQRYKRFFFQLILGLLVGSLIQLIFPFNSMEKLNGRSCRQPFLSAGAL